MAGAGKTEFQDSLVYMSTCEFQDSLAFMSACEFHDSQNYIVRSSLKTNKKKETEARNSTLSIQGIYRKRPQTTN